MILDAIIGLLALIFASILEGVMAIVAKTLNLLAGITESVVGLFITGFSLGRIVRKRKDSRPGSTVTGLVIIVLALGVVAWFAVAPKVLHREITLLAEDGHSLPFAALVIHTKDGEEHRRTDSTGNITVPRFGTTGITVKDPRYTSRTWSKAEITSTLTVQRTILGSGLDSLAERLLKPETDSP